MNRNLTGNLILFLWIKNWFKRKCIALFRNLSLKLEKINNNYRNNNNNNKSNRFRLVRTLRNSSKQLSYRVRNRIKVKIGKRNKAIFRNKWKKLERNSSSQCKWWAIMQILIIIKVIYRTRFLSLSSFLWLRCRICRNNSFSASSYWKILTRISKLFLFKISLLLSRIPLLWLDTVLLKV